jgi:hypothetical protein
MFVPLSRGLAVLTRIIHERFYCNRGNGSQNLMRYSLFAPRSCKGRSTLQARWRRTQTRSTRRPGRRARRSFGHHTVCQVCLPSSRAPLWSLPRPLLQGGQPPCRIPTKGAHHLRNSQAEYCHASRLCAPVSRGDYAISRRTVMNNAGNPRQNRLTVGGVSSRVSTRMLKKSASFVLAALRGSTYRSVRLASSLAAAFLGARRGPGRRGCLGRLRAGGCSSRQGWAGEKSGLFEHPVWHIPVVSDVCASEVLACHNSFFAAC